MKTDWKIAVKLGVFISLLGMMIFLMIEVVFGLVIKGWIEKYSVDSPYIVILIFSLGFLLSLGISLLAGYLASEQVETRTALIAGIFAFLANFAFWVLLAYQAFTPYLEGLSFIQKIVLMPKCLTYYSIMYYPNITLIWLLAQISYAIFYSILLLLIKAPVKQTYSRKKRSEWI